MPILPCSFGTQQIVERFKFGGFVFVRIGPQADRLIGDEVVDKPLGVIDVDVTAPPLLRIPDVRQDEKRFHRFENILRQKPGDDGLGTADVHVKILHAAFRLAHHPLDDRAAARRHKLSGNAVAAGEGELHGFAQFRARRNRRDNLTLFLRRFDDFVPFSRLGLSEHEH